MPTQATLTHHIKIQSLESCFLGIAFGVVMILCLNAVSASAMNAFSTLISFVAEVSKNNVPNSSASCCPRSLEMTLSCSR